MSEYICDSCSGKIEQGDIRYVFELKLYAAPELMLSEDDLDRDIAEEIARLSEMTKDMSEKELLEQVYIADKFTLCAHCRDIFVKRIAHKEFI